MYSLHVELKDASASGRSEVEEAPEESSSSTVHFSVGNPRVEHITGTVHLYRTKLKQPEVAEPGQPPQVRRCCMATPANTAPMASLVTGVAPRHAMAHVPFTMLLILRYLLNCCCWKCVLSVHSWI